MLIPVHICLIERFYSFFLIDTFIGTIPTEIGDLQRLRKLSASYNELKGSIPSTIRSLKNMELFHLHGNQLEGDADFFEKDLDSFIVDCGNTDKSTRLVNCDTCTECCNEEGNCITLAKVWPRENFEAVPLEIEYIIILLVLACWVIFLFISFVIRLAKEHLPSMDCPFNSFQTASTYKFLLGSNKLAITIALFTTLFKVITTFVFFQAGDYSSETNDWMNTVR